MTRSPEFRTLQKVITKLTAGRIPYMLTGSMALNFYGHPRATNDFDIVIEVQDQDTRRIVTLFEKEFYISASAVDEAIARKTLFNIIDNETVFKIDLIVKKRDPYSQTQFERSLTKEFDGLKIQVISPEDLILAKLAWSMESHSETQERDILNLLRILKNSLDRTYLEKWGASLGCLERLQGFYASI